MAKKATAGAGGAHLASGYISLNVKYGSAMAQIVDDFGVMKKRSKETGESITRNLVAGVDAAKAKATALAQEYEAQRQKVAALRAEVMKLHAAQANSSAAEKAFQNANATDHQRNIQYKQKSISLQIELNKLLEAPKRNSADLGAWNAKFVEMTKQRKAQLKELAEVEAAAVAARKGGPQAAAAEEAARKSLDAELAKGTQEYKKLGQALQDLTRKQELAKASAAGLQGVHQTIGSRFVSMMRNTGTQAGQEFRSTFGSQMNRATSEVGGQMKNMAAKTRNAMGGIFMGMTPGVMGAAGVGVALGAAFSAGFNREETMNTTKLRLKALGMSAQEVSNLISTATKTVEGTQYSLAEAFTASSTAMQAGIAQGAPMEQYLNNIANAAGLTGVAYGEVAESIGRVQRQGYVSMENIDPLIKKDLNILGWLKDYYSKEFPATTQMDITDMISKKMIPADVMNKVLTENLNNSMKGLTRLTVRGALADMMTQVGKVTQSILQPFMGDWPTFINSIGDKLKKFAEYIKPGMATAAAWIKRTWNDLWPKVTAVVSKAVTFMSGLWDRFGPKVMGALGWLKAKWQELWPQLMSLGKTFFEWWSKAWDYLGGVFDRVWPYLTKFFTMLKNTWQKMWPQLMAHWEPFKAAFKRLWDSLAPIIGPVLKVLAGLFAWVVTEGVKKLPALAQAFTNMMNWLATAIDWMRNEAWPWMKKAWKNVGEWIGDAIETVGRWKDNVVKAFEDIKKSITPVWTWLEDKWKWLDGLTMPQWAKWLIDKGALLFGPVSGVFERASYETALPASDNVPKPARLRDSGHVASGPQSKHVAGLLLKMFPGIEGDIGGSYLPMSEGGPSQPGTHDAGMSIDIPIGQSAEQRAMGDEINAYLQANAKALGIVYSIWKDIGTQTGVDPKRPAGTTFESGGHQDHIDVMFDGKTFGKDIRDAAMAGSPQPVAAAVGSSNTLWDKIAAKESNGVWDDNNSGNHTTSSGAPRGGLQITDGTWKAFGGTEFAPTANQATKAQQIVVAKRIAFQGYKGSAPQGLSAWEVVTQGKVAGVTPSMTADDFGGITNLSVSKPLAPSNVVPQPPSPSVVDVILGRNLPPDTNTSMLAPQRYGGPVPETGFMPPMDFPDTGPVGKDLAFVPGKDMPDNAFIPQGVHDPNEIAPGIIAPGKMPSPIDVMMGLAPAPPVGTTMLTPTVPVPKPGPKGTQRDPIVTTDPKVAENTDPKNQPKPGEAHEGSGDAPGPAAPPTYDSSSPMPGGGSPGSAGDTKPGGEAYKDLASGLGGVASQAFSDQFAGTPFSDPTQWSGTKSIGAALSFFGALLTGGGSGAAGGLVGMLFPGSANGEKPATTRQLRDAAKSINRQQDDIKAQQAEVNAMVGKPQYTAEDRLEASDKLADMMEDLGDKQADYAAMQGKGGALPFDPFANLKSQWGIGGTDPATAVAPVQDIMAPVPVPGRAPVPGAPAAAGQPGFVQQPFGNASIGSPGVAPGVMGAPNVMQPGSANVGSALMNTIPQQPATPASLAPGQANTGGATNNVDMSITQQVATPGIDAATNAAKRAQNTQWNSSLLNLTKGVLV